MKMEEYLNKVTDQIRCKRAHESVREELQNHILDQMEAYKLGGMEEEEALEKAVMDMGDPVIVGNSFDRIHRPRISWSMLILVGIISIFSIVFQMILYRNGSDVTAFTAKKQILFVVAGYICMLAVYYLDYSFLGRYGTTIGAVFVGFFVLSIPFQRTINGTTRWLSVGGISVNLPLIMCLFIPIFGGILFQYRGQGYWAIGKSILWMGAVVGLTISKSFPYAFCLGAVMLVMLVLAVGKGWLSVNKKYVLGTMGGVLAGGILLGAVSVISAVSLGNYLPGYQLARIQAIVNHDQDVSYIASKAGKILKDSQWIGAKVENMKLAATDLPGAESELVLVSITACCGILAGILVVGLMLYLIQKILRISLEQKNQLGMMVGCGCGTLLGTMLFFSLLQNLTSFPITSILLPFFSNSGSGTIVFYILLGMVLSIYRYQNLPRSQRKKRKLKVYFE